MPDESTFTHHEPCPSCGSRDNLARYDDGHGYCFGCGYHVSEDGGDGRVRTMPKGLIDRGDFKPLVKRGITEETCRKFDYTVSSDKGKVVHVAEYKDESRAPVAQKIRSADKTFTVTGDLSAALPLWGQHLWRDGGRKVVVTEGEIDAMSVSQAQGNKWPVVSVPTGAKGAPKAIARAIEWLSTYDDVVLMFDDDEPGREAAEKCAVLLPPGKAKIATIDGHKDANAALVAGEGGKIVDAMWGAKAYRPDGVIQIEELFEEALKPIDKGAPWWMPSLTEATYGRRPGEIYTFGAATGAGKTDWLIQQASFDIMELGLKVGLVFLETPGVELTRRLAGKVSKSRFHLPSGEDPERDKSLAEAMEELRGKVSIYKYNEDREYEKIISRMRYMVVAEGVQMIYMDHLTALADPNDERATLEVAMKGFASFAQELGCTLHIVSHLATPEGRPHEEGGRVMLRHFRGSRSIGFWSHFAFGLERDQQAEQEDERRLVKFRILKNRLTGTSVGSTFPVSYDIQTGMMFEVKDNPFEEGKDDDSF